MNKEEMILKIKEELTKKGLPIAEEVAEMIFDIVKKVIIEAVEKSETKLDDLALPIIKKVFDVIDQKLEEIDGIKNEKKI